MPEVQRKLKTLSQSIRIEWILTLTNFLLSLLQYSFNKKTYLFSQSILSKYFYKLTNTTKKIVIKKLSLSIKKNLIPKYMNPTLKEKI